MLTNLSYAILILTFVTIVSFVIAYFLSAVIESEAEKYFNKKEKQ